MKSELISTADLRKTLDDVLRGKSYDRIFTISDVTTARLCLPLLGLQNSEDITIDEGEPAKSIETLQYIWQQLEERGARRHSLLINVGGGMVSDIGGFAAATFKRGIDHINIPTTLLAMVDASIGGKTGVNFLGLKNNIGAFRMPVATIISAKFLQTLPLHAIMCGVAEMLKHALLDSPQHLAEMINDDFPFNADADGWQEKVMKSVQIKQRFVDADPFESGCRKALNLGHTFAHAFEALSLRRAKTSTPLSHGYAVAYGIVCALYMSCTKCRFPQDSMRQTVRFITEHYGRPTFTCDDYEELLTLMRHDKKNSTEKIRFVLLKNIGEYTIDADASDEEIREALDFLREG